MKAGIFCGLAFLLLGSALDLSGSPVTTAESILGSMLVGGGDEPSLSKEFDNLSARGQWDEAIKVARRCVAENPEDAGWHFKLGSALFKSGNPAEAVPFLRNSEFLNNDTVELHQLLGLCYFELRQYQLFRGEMEAVLGRQKDFHASYSLARYYQTIELDPEQALSLFSEAVNLDPSHTLSRYHYAHCLKMVGRLSEAKEHYRKAIELAESSGSKISEAYQELAELLADSEPSTALDFALRATQLEPGRSWNHLTLAQVMETLGHRDDAIRSLERAVSLDPDDPIGHYRLYRLYEGKGDAQKAQTELAIYRELKTRARDQHGQFVKSMGAGSVYQRFSSGLNPAFAPQASSKQEFDLYLDVEGSSTAETLLEKSADFIGKFPQSELLGKIYESRMTAHSALEHFDGVVDSGRRLLKLFPDHLRALLNLSLVLSTAANTDREQTRSRLHEAENYAHRAFSVLAGLAGESGAKKEMVAEGHQALGQIAMQRNTFESAISEFRKAIAVSPEPKGMHHLFLGLACREAGQITDARSAFEKAMGLGPESIRELARRQLADLEDPARRQ